MTWAAREAANVVVSPLRVGRVRLTPMVITAMLVLAACEMLAPMSDFPATAVPMAPPAAYATWWQRTEGCAQRTGSFTRIRWYVVPGVMTFPTREGPKVGLWSRIGSEVRIAVAQGYLDNELVVRHEMLHALLDREGHPSLYFEQRCHLTWETWQG
jgi:hypothetical protein